MHDEKSWCNRLLWSFPIQINVLFVIKFLFLHLMKLYVMRTHICIIFFLRKTIIEFIICSRCKGALIVSFLYQVSFFANKVL